VLEEDLLHRLLRRAHHQRAPEMRYGSQEMYAADSAAEITDNYGTDLEDGARHYSNKLSMFKPLGQCQLGCDLAWSDPGREGPGEFHLSLAALNGTSYPSSPFTPISPPSALDRIDEDNDYVNTYLNMPESYLNRTYGHAVYDSTGRLWLQYWFFEYYNDFAVAGVGNHEGDWEMIEVRLDQSYSPDEVIFAQHKHAALCTFGEIEQTPTGAPITYVARGSHADYPHSGGYDTGVVGHDDHAYGDGLVTTPQVTVIDDSTSWVHWPGHWGGSDASPDGPGEKPQWNNPLALLPKGEGCTDNLDPGDGGGFMGGATASSSGRPQLVTATAARLGTGRVHITYRIPHIGQIRRVRKHGATLLVSLTSARTRRVIVTIPIARPHKTGQMSMPPIPHRERSIKLVVRASLVLPNGHRSAVSSTRVR
jgi:hypothetical protein